MPDLMMLSLEPQRLDSGSPEECATFGQLTIRINGDLLTFGIETEHSGACDGPYVSGYALAEWFVWNWWRIMWESTDILQVAPYARHGWALSHHMNTAGDGYAWPCIEIESDGKYATLTSRPSGETHGTLFRYFGSRCPQTVPVETFEAAVDEFVEDMLSRLNARGVNDTNLHVLWRDLKREREQDEVARYRKLEAMFGYDADEIDDKMITDRLEEADYLGKEALAELIGNEAILRTFRKDRSWYQEIEKRAAGGFDMNAENALHLDDLSNIPPYGSVHAWKFGQTLAQALRQQERINDHCISHEQLASYAGTVSGIISDRPKRRSDLPFVLNKINGASKVTLRSRWVAGRRFELARLIGDHVVHRQIENTNERLYPATFSYSYRQKMQRAFAAEFLCPFQAVKEMVGDNPSEEKQTEVANLFKVYERTVRTQLVNNHILHIEDAPDIVGRGGPNQAFH